jgi:prepilin signal peptidase PulO-like enzyme (type II secretory pathway)
MTVAPSQKALDEHRFRGFRYVIANPITPYKIIPLHSIGSLPGEALTGGAEYNFNAFVACILQPIVSPRNHGLFEKTIAWDLRKVVIGRFPEV